MAESSSTSEDLSTSTSEDLSSSSSSEEPSSSSSEDLSTSSSSEETSSGGDQSSDSSCDTYFHLVARDDNTELGTREGNADHPLHIIGTRKPRTVTVEAVLDSGSWEPEEPIWEGEGLVSPQDGDTTAQWKDPDREGKKYEISAAACNIEDKVDIEVHDPEEKKKEITSQTVFGELPEKLKKILADLKLGAVEISGLDKKITRKSTLAEVYGDPGVDWTREFDGTVELTLSFSGKVSVGPFQLPGGHSVEAKLCDYKVSGTHSIDFNALKHDWSKPDGTNDTGWSGGLAATAKVSVDLNKEIGSFPLPQLTGYKKVTLLAGASLAVSIDLSLDPDTFEITASAGLSKLAIPITMELEKVNGGVDTQSLTEVGLGFLAKAVSVTFYMSRDPWLNDD